MFIEAANETKTENQALFGFVGGEKVEIVGDVGAPYTATGVASKGQSKEGRPYVHNISCNLWYCNVHSPQKANFKTDWL